MITWATIGLYVSDAAEKKFGYEATEKDKQELRGLVPRVRVVEE